MSAVRKCRRIDDARPDQGPDTPDARPAPASAWELAPEADRERARARLAAVRRSDALVAEGAPRVEADARAAAEGGVSARGLRRWRRQVRSLPEGERVAALLDGARTGRPSLLDAAACDELAALAFTHGPHLTAAHARRVLVARGHDAPSRSTIRNWLTRFRSEHGRDLSAVLNPDRHRSHRKPAAGDAAAGIEAPGQLWELDSTLADVLCADGKRRALVAGVDVATRRARVLVVPVSRASAIAALLRRCILDWGVPGTVRTDEGRDYTSRHVLGVLKDLEIDHDPCPPYTPEAKPFVERFLGTLARDLLAFLPGFTGHDVAQAQALRSRRSFAERRGEGALRTYRVALAAEELQARIDAWLSSVYERRPHSGLDAKTPFDVATAWSGEVRRVRDERALDALLEEPEERSIGKKGIGIDRGIYIAAELGALVGERVRVRRDPADLGRVHVYRLEGGFVCVAEDPARTGVDRAEVAARMREHAKAADREARAWSNELKRRYSPETAMDDVLTHAEREAKRLVAFPREGRAHETPALAEAAVAVAVSEQAAAPAPRRRAKRVLAAVGRLVEKEAI